MSQNFLDENLSPKKPKKSLFKTILLTLAGGLGLLTVVGTAGIFYIRTQFEARYIASGSMQPTLEVNDRILIDKFLDPAEAIQRGDIILFNPTQTLQTKGIKDALISRAIGLPGETIEVKQGGVWINGQALKENYLLEAPQYQFGPVKIPANSYFVLGDNRNNSYDSHFWGFVTRDLIIGRATRIYLPAERSQALPRPEYNP